MSLPRPDAPDVAPSAAAGSGEATIRLSQVLDFYLESLPLPDGSVARAALLWDPPGPILGWPAGTNAAEPLVAAARLAQRSGETVRADAGADGAILAVPLPGGAPGAGALACLLPDAGAVDAASEALARGAGWLARLLGDALQPPADDPVLPAAWRALGAADTAQLRAVALAEVLAESFACTRAAVVRLGRGGRMRTAALSHGRRCAPRTPLAHALAHDTRRALAGDEPVLEGRSGLVVPLRTGPQAVGVWVLTREDDAGFTAVERARLAALADALAGAMWLSERAERDPVHRVQRALGGGANREHTRRPGFLAAAVLAVAALGFAALPGPYRVKASAAVEGEAQQAIVAPFDSYIAAVHVSPGDSVAAGQPLVSFTPDDLRLAQVKWASERARAVAARRDAAARQERAKLRVLDAQIEHANAELELVSAQIARLELTAPVAGTVVSGDLSQQLGAPVRRGEPLFELVPGDAWRLRLLVDEADVNDLAPGMRGTLKLNAYPAERFEFVLQRVTPVSEVTPEGNHFIAYAALADAAVPLRPGMGGIARIEAGERPRAAAWTRALRVWLALAWWRWFG